MKYFGLIGYPLSHSFSSKYFAEKFKREGIGDCVYENFPIADIGLFPALIRNNRDLIGVNVTIPYKQLVMQYLDEVDQDAQSIGAVNTVKISRQNERNFLKGFNTDAYGFLWSLKPHLKPFYKKALILGTGGASKAVSHVLKNLEMDLTFVSRTPKKEGQISYSEVTDHIIKENFVIVNTSPVGMMPDIEGIPDLPYNALTKDHLLFDLIYNPAETRFLAMGREKGAQVVNGLQMLHLQAEKAWELWNS